MSISDEEAHQWLACEAVEILKGSDFCHEFENAIMVSSRLCMVPTALKIASDYCTTTNPLV